MALLTTTQIVIVGAIGGIAAITSLAVLIVLALLLFALFSRIHDFLHDRRARRRALRDGRRQLANLHTIEDLKE